MNVRRTRAFLVALMSLCGACDRTDDPAAGKIALETRGQALAAPAKSPLPPGAPFDELAVVPADSEAVVRVDLAQVGARSERPAEGVKTLDFLLHAQQPAVWQLLHDAGITVGKEIATLYLAVCSGDAILIVGLGHFDVGRLGTNLRHTDATVEPAPAPRGQTAALFTWKHPSAGALGALEQRGELADAAVGVGGDDKANGIVVFGPAALVRRALASRAGLGADVRTSALAGEMLAIDPTATVWGVALPGPTRAWLSTTLPGIRRARFQASLASPGPDIDGLFTLRAEFASRDQAAAFGDKLRQILQTVALLGSRSPLGAGFAKLKDASVVKLEDTIVVASAAL